jgi:hypothetical protein
MNTDAPHSQSSSPAKAGDPVFRDLSDRSDIPQRTGYSAFAEYDDSSLSFGYGLRRFARNDGVET